MTWNFFQIKLHYLFHSAHHSKNICHKVWKIFLRQPPTKSDLTCWQRSSAAMPSVHQFNLNIDFLIFAKPLTYHFSHLNRTKFYPAEDSSIFLLLDIKIYRWVRNFLIIAFRTCWKFVNFSSGCLLDLLDPDRISFESQIPL